MTQKKEKNNLTTKADDALKVYSLHSGPNNKLNDELTRKRKKEETSQLERKNQALRDHKRRRKTASPLRQTVEGELRYFRPI